MDKEQSIIQSWQANAGNWIRLIEAGGIESRKLVTNKAIIDAIVSTNPASVLDIGCGEGWLTNELSKLGMISVGVDVVPELIGRAKENMNGSYFVASYEDISSYKFKMQISRLFDTIVVNFALLGKDSTENLLAALPAYLSPGGKLLIQTLHPDQRKEMNDYVTGWKQGSWLGLGDHFTMPYEWYFRTMEDWLALLRKSGFGKVWTIETSHPHTGKPISVIFECHVK
jgi:2-polyprenyl-3-methyl-5-hydroxy-6-metoxy-1,4-benzoquinol methylase